MLTAKEIVSRLEWHIEHPADASEITQRSREIIPELFIGAFNLEDMRIEEHLFNNTRFSGAYDHYFVWKGVTFQTYTQKPLSNL